MSASSRSSDEEPGVELEGLSNPTKKGSSSWRLAAMFAKSQSNSKSDKGMLLRFVYTAAAAGKASRYIAYGVFGFVTHMGIRIRSVHTTFTAWSCDCSIIGAFLVSIASPDRVRV